MKTELFAACLLMIGVIATTLAQTSLALSLQPRKSREYRVIAVVFGVIFVVVGLLSVTNALVILR